jgi:hypothetical protein
MLKIRFLKATGSIIVDGGTIRSVGMMITMMNTGTIAMMNTGTIADQEWV